MSVCFQFLRPLHDSHSLAFKYNNCQQGKNTKTTLTSDVPKNTITVDLNSQHRGGQASRHTHDDDKITSPCWMSFMSRCKLDMRIPTAWERLVLSSFTTWNTTQTHTLRMTENTPVMNSIIWLYLVTDPERLFTRDRFQLRSPQKMEKWKWLLRDWKQKPLKTGLNVQLFENTAKFIN